MTNPDVKLYVNGDINIDRDTGKLQFAVGTAKRAYIKSNSVNNAIEFGGYNGSDNIELMRIHGSTGFVGIGTTNPQAALHVNGNMKIASSRMTFVQEGLWNGIRMETGHPDGVSTRLYFSRLSDGVGVELYAGSFNVTSSMRYKTDILPYTKGLPELLQMQPVSYKLKNTNIDSKQVGFIAEELDTIGLTEHISYDNSNLPESLNYASLIILCVNAIKELNQKVIHLQDQVNVLVSS